MSKQADDAADADRRHYLENKERERVERDREFGQLRLRRLEDAILYLLDREDAHCKRIARRKGEPYRRNERMREVTNGILESIAERA